MRPSFRHFMKYHDFPVSIKEQEAAPSVGSAPTSPDNPDTTNKHHFDTIEREFGIGDEEMISALEGQPIQVWQVPDYSSKWGYLVAGPCSVIVTKRSDGNFDILYQLAQKKLMNPHSFILPYKKGERPVKYEGQVTDQKEIITVEELQDLMSKPLSYGGAMGGDPMGGGMPGAPPMGGPPGGMPGAPMPPGGGAPIGGM